MQPSDQAFVADYLERSSQALHGFAHDPGQLALLGRMAELLTSRIRDGGKLLIAGNGGSAGDAQHVAAEFTGRMLYNRDPLPAIALTTDTSALTAIGNDYGFDLVFERQVRALGRPGDVFWGLSTSGNSPNVLRAMEAARAAGMAVIGMTGKEGRSMATRADMLLLAPSGLTPIIQQIHLVAAHVLCILVERALHPQPA